MKVDSRPRSLRRPPRPEVEKHQSLPEAKFPDPVVCPKCNASYHKGRWSWTAAPPEATKLKCPACRRIEANYPAGEVNLTGVFLQEHRADVLNLVMSREARARRDFPMQRIIDVVAVGDGVRVTTTDGHLARTIAIAVHEACKGELDLRFEKDPVFVRATWSR
ncbi:MAG TPA: BCAM0308 family protein [Usitatibacter sp.]|nr:BCAM0308 family protein [Usitatibacter sp.]